MELFSVRPFVLLCLASFTQHSVVLLLLFVCFNLVYPCGSMNQTLMIFSVVEQYSIVCIDHSVCIHSPVDGHWVFFYLWLLSVVLLWTFMYKYLFEHLFSILLGIVGSYGSSLFTFSRNQPFSTAAAQFYILTSNVGVTWFRLIFTYTCYFPFLKL